MRNDEKSCEAVNFINFHEALVEPEFELKLTRFILS